MKIESKKLVSLYEAQSSSSLQNKKADFKKDASNKNSSNIKNDRIEISNKGLKHGEILALKSNLVDSIV